MKCFLPVTDKLLYESPASRSLPLVPYVPGMRCVHQERTRTREPQPQPGSRAHEA